MKAQDGLSFYGRSLIVAGAFCLGIFVPNTKTEAAEVNLLEKYPTTLTTGDSDPNRARPWEFSQSDIFHLSGFSFQVGTNLAVDTEEADLGIGHCADGAVWAVLIPRATGTLTSGANAQPEPISHVWLRFHPAVINQLFPPTTVTDDGDRNLAPQMVVIANFKLRSSWHAGNNVMIPAPNELTVDVDTRGGPRRFFAVDTTAGTAQYISAFEQQTVPIPPAITPELAAAAFDQLWNAFDSDYAMFVLRPEVDWDALKTQERPLALASQSTYEFAGVCADMLKPLRDLHVWLTVSGAYVPVYDRPRPSNANPNAYASLLGSLNGSSSSLQWAVTPDHVGFIAIYNWTDSSLPTQFDAALEYMRNTRGLIIDVRLNGGGSEPLAQQVAARFIDQQVTYAYSQYRNGPLHTNLTEKLPRTLSPRGPFRYDRPVIVLIGQKCMSSNESFIAMMTRAPQVVTMGDHTAGSSGNPEIIQLPLDMTVSVPQWIDYLPDGTPLDEKGITPDLPFSASADAFEGQRDDLLSAALQRMHAEVLPLDPIPNPDDNGSSGPTVCDIFLTDGRVYHSATLDLSEIHLMTGYGELTVPTNDLIRLTFSSVPDSDVAATAQFLAVGQIVETSFSGHTPGGPFFFQRSQLKEIDFGLPATLAAKSPSAPFHVLWTRGANWDIESIYHTGDLGYSQAALIAENLGAGNTEITEDTKLTPALLAKYDAVVFLNRDSGVILTPDETQALRGFLAAGNGVLVIGQQDGGFPLSGAAQFANSVTMPYGIELTTMTPNTRSAPDSTQLVPHPLTQGLSSVPGGGSLLRVAPPAQVLAITATNTGVLAISTFGKGRMVVVSDDSDLWDMTIDPKYDWNQQRYPYALNIFKWLLSGAPRISASPHVEPDGLHLFVLAVAGQVVHLQRSTDLKTWSDWKTVTATGLQQAVIDNTAATSNTQFYRAAVDQ